MNARIAPTSCAHCLAWGLLFSRCCGACSGFASRHSAGRCAGCARWLPVHKHYCRLCWCQARIDAVAAATPGPAEAVLPQVRHHQLFFAHMNPRCGRGENPRTAVRHGRRGRPRRLDPPPTSKPPAVGVQLTLFDVARVLQPLSADHVKRSAHAATTPAARVLVALAAIHAARVGAILALQLDDLDLGNRRLTIAGRSHPLDDLTHHVVLDWLNHRRKRWPNTANPHLIINKHTALEIGPATGDWASLLLHRQTATFE